MFIILDGDDIGRRITRAYVTNDVPSLSLVALQVQNSVDAISDLMESRGLRVHFCAADGVVGEAADDFEAEHFYGEVRRLAVGDLTFSAGSGPTLREAYLALTYAKSTGKNVHCTSDHVPDQGN